MKQYIMNKLRVEMGIKKSETRKEIIKEMEDMRGKRHR